MNAENNEFSSGVSFLGSFFGQAKNEQPYCGAQKSVNHSCDEQRMNKYCFLYKQESNNPFCGEQEIDRASCGEQESINLFCFNKSKIFIMIND